MAKKKPREYVVDTPEGRVCRLKACEADKIEETIFLKEQSKHFQKELHYRNYEICGLIAAYCWQ